MLIGPSDEQWDLCFIAEYPNLDAFVSMIKNSDYRKAMEHRQIAVKTSRLIRTGPLELGACEWHAHYAHRRFDQYGYDLLSARYIYYG